MFRFGVGKSDPTAGAKGGSEPGFRLRLSTGQTFSLPDGKRLTGAELPVQGHAAASVVAEVARNPQNPTALGLKNLTARAWTATLSTGARRQIDAGRSIQLAPGTRINFGGLEGEIQQDGSASAAPNTRRRWLLLSLALAFILGAGVRFLLGAFVYHGHKPAGDNSQLVATLSVGPDGAKANLPGGGSIEVPKGALGEPTTINVYKSPIGRRLTLDSPSGGAPLVFPPGALSVYSLTPIDTVLLRPIELALPVPDGQDFLVVVMANGEPRTLPGGAAGRTVRFSINNFDFNRPGAIALARRAQHGGRGMGLWEKLKEKLGLGGDSGGGGRRPLNPDEIPGGFPTTKGPTWTCINGHAGNPAGVAFCNSCGKSRVTKQAFSAVNLLGTALVIAAVIGAAATGYGLVVAAGELLEGAGVAMAGRAAAVGVGFVAVGAAEAAPEPKPGKPSPPDSARPTGTGKRTGLWVLKDSAPDFIEKGKDRGWDTDISRARHYYTYTPSLPQPTAKESMKPGALSRIVYLFDKSGKAFGKGPELIADLHWDYAFKTEVPRVLRPGDPTVRVTVAGKFAGFIRKGWTEHIYVKLVADGFAIDGPYALHLGGDSYGGQDSKWLGEGESSWNLKPPAQPLEQKPLRFTVTGPGKPGESGIPVLVFEYEWKELTSKELEDLLRARATK